MGLPERTLYNVDQLAEHWKCKTDDLLHMIERGLLHPHFSISAHCRRERWNEANSRWCPVDMFGKEINFLCNKALPFDDPQYKGHRCCVMGFRGIFPLLESVWWPHRWPFEVPLRADWQGDLKGRWLFHEGFDYRIALLESHTVTPADFLFPLVEVKRFESEHALKQAIATPAAKKADIPPQNRRDALAKILVEIVQDFQQKHNRTPQYNDVVNKLKNLCKNRNHPIIQEVSDGKVYWKNRSGKEQTTSIKQVQNRLTRIYAE